MIIGPARWEEINRMFPDSKSSFTGEWKNIRMFVSGFHLCYVLHMTDLSFFKKGVKMLLWRHGYGYCCCNICSHVNLFSADYNSETVHTGAM